MNGLLQFFIAIIVCCPQPMVRAFGSSAIPPLLQPSKGDGAPLPLEPTFRLAIIQIANFDQAMAIVDTAATSGAVTDDLHPAVTWIEANAAD